MTDASGSIEVDVPTADGGVMENTVCEMCIATNCGAPQTACIQDCNVDDAGTPACGSYAVCVYSAFLTNLETSDAGQAGEGADLTAAQASCAGTFPATSISAGNALIGCIASSCGTASGGCVP